MKGLPPSPLLKSFEFPLQHLMVPKFSKQGFFHVYSTFQAGHFHYSSSSVPVFPRYKLNGVLYQVFNNKRLRNSSTCKFKSVNGMAAFGSICDKQSIAIIATFSSVKDAYENLRPASIAELNSYSTVNSCIYSAEKLSTSFHAVPVSSIIAKCVHVPSQ